MKVTRDMEGIMHNYPQTCREGCSDCGRTQRKRHKEQILQEIYCKVAFQIKAIIREEDKDPQSEDYYAGWNSGVEAVYNLLERAEFFLLGWDSVQRPRQYEGLNEAQRLVWMIMDQMRDRIRRIPIRALGSRAVTGND